MRTISKIVRQKQNPHRFDIYIDGEQTVTVHEDVLVRFQLRKGQTLETDDLIHLLAEGDKNKGRQIALKWLSHKLRTEKEVFDYLLNKGFSGECASSVVNWLKQYGYLNDRAFATAWVESRRRAKGKSSRLLREELRRKGIDEPLIDEALSAVSEADDLSLARRLAHKRYERLRQYDWATVERRIGSFLGRRGFSHAHIRTVLEELKDVDGRCE